MIALTSLASATEGGGSMYPMGAENFMVGAMPPPGFYGQVYGQRYQADRLRDNDGKALPLDFSLEANVIAPRLVWVTEQELLGGKLAFHSIVPLVDLKVSINGESQRKREVGDITIGAGLGYHLSEKSHVAVGLDVFAPTGKFDRDELANIGRNHWTIQPVAAFTHVDPEGLNVDVKAMYDFNTRNSDTDYRSGQELHADYSLGWGVGSGWVLGVGGYVYQQTTTDKVNDDRVEDNKGRAFAIGPSVKYTSSDGWFLTAKWQQESGVRNRPEGEAYWLKLTFPL
ncbi:SphA family protein [Marinobacter adhaerens]|uniref:SphA family protein n=1 Tax=Marinobacter adhaerens TaxID=1033846 RepID=UPI001E50734B|nr:transporter [Marinobacter adhaerens]